MADVSRLDLEVLARHFRHHAFETSRRNPYEQQPFDARFGTEVRRRSSEVTEDYPLRRMYASRIGRVAAESFENEEEGLSVLNAIGADLLVELLFSQDWPGKRRRGLRGVVVPGGSGIEAQNSVIILDPKLSYQKTQNITGSLEFSDAFIRRLEGIVLDYTNQADEKVRNFARFLHEQGPSCVTETFWIIQPDVIVSRRPRMRPLCAPSEHIVVECDEKTSTAGVFCRDLRGELGVTGCFHGTGPVGTRVRVGFQKSSVAIANNVQDLVFLPLNPGYNIPPVYGAAGVLHDRTPGQYDAVEFEGATSGRVKTHITSYDSGLLRLHAALQLKVQTPADTNTGDSGAALVNQDNKVIGFAFQRSAFGEIPEMTDWIWASNAMKALNLTAI